jgi:magnesium transporter
MINNHDGILLPSKMNKDDLNQLKKIVDIIYDLLDTEQEKIVDIFETLHPANAAAILQFLTSNAREQVVGILGQKFDPEILNYLDETVLENVLDLWAMHEIAQKLEKLEEQEVLKILEDLDTEERRAMLRALNPKLQLFLEEGLAYQENTAGRKMKHQVVAVPYEWTIVKVLTFLRTAINLPKDLNEIFVVDKNRKPIGSIELSSILQQKHNHLIVKDIINPLEVIFSATDNIKNIIFAFKTYSMKCAPVVDKNEKLIGVIHITDIIDAMYQEIQDEFLHSGGLEESDFYSKILETSKARLKWLSFSMLGSIGVTILIDTFRYMIARNPVLVGMMTITTSISSVASVQVVTIIVRALVNRELNAINAKRIFFKEILVALINGIVLGLFFALLFRVGYGSNQLSLLIAISLVISMIYSAITGTIFPIILNKIGIDPALSAGAFLTCSMDALSTSTFFIIAKFILT